MDGIDKILFVFGIKEDMGMIVFDAVWAKKGYGPIAYKVTMSMMGSLSPVQDSKITTSAKGVWKEFFDGKGSDDVTKDFFGTDKTNWQRYNYTLKTKVNYSKNLQNHKKFLGKDPYNERKDMMNELADGILVGNMREIY